MASVGSLIGSEQINAHISSVQWRGMLVTAGGGFYDAVFSGNLGVRIDNHLSVGGNVSKGGGSFKIDHPLDPKEKYLYHSFVESPDMMNIYNGNVSLDGQGTAVVTMPEWFEALNREFRYQLTSIGAPGPNLYIAQQIHGNQFVISGGEPGAIVSWLVTGVRKDAWAEKNRIPVEERKSEHDRGFYLHPDAFDQPDEMGITVQRDRLREADPTAPVPDAPEREPRGPAIR
jgi:hypothetical protein